MRRSVRALLGLVLVAASATCSAAALRARSLPLHHRSLAEKPNVAEQARAWQLTRQLAAGIDCGGARA